MASTARLKSILQTEIPCEYGHETVEHIGLVVVKEKHVVIDELQLCFVTRRWFAQDLVDGQLKRGFVLGVY